MKQIDHDENEFPDDKRNLFLAVAFVVFAVIMAALTWFLKMMSLEFVMGFVCGFFLMAGLFAIISKEFRNLS